MLVLRSLLFTVWLYLAMVLVAVLGSPALLGPRRWSLTVIRTFVRLCLFGLRVFVGAKMEIRGLEHRPTGTALIAGKHQSMLDTIAPFLFLDDPCFVMKSELIAMPFFGWYAAKAQMIPVVREDAAKALRKMVSDTQARLSEQRQVLIFPEGTRSAVGQPADYKPGVAALYRELDTPCTLMATNSGVFWPAKGFIRHPGTIVFEFLPALPAGMKRAAFMSEMKTRIEAASDALVAEAQNR